MKRLARFPITASLAVVTGTILWLSCSGNQPQLVIGPQTFTNTPPTLQILSPNSSFAINQGERFGIRWADTDPDSAAVISFSLQDTTTGSQILLVTNLPENDTAGPDQFTVNTSLIPLGTYFLFGEISDGINAPVTAFALVEGTSTRAQITIGAQGTNPLSVPPRVAVIAPRFNLGVAQDDILTITVQPRDEAPSENFPYDPDSDTTLFILLDLDNDPDNDDPGAPDPAKNIVLRTVDVAQGDFEAQTFTIPVDLAVIPPREDGLPYFIRATIRDAGNRPVHDYAAGTINILRSATGTVDLINVGTTLSGARFQGFNPGSLLGSNMVGIGDFDNDGTDDFVLVAQKGNPRNFGNIGEAYLIYGLPNQRFGGSINVNSVSTDVSGVILEAPPNRLAQLHDDPVATPRGITSVARVDDLTGDGRPDLLFGLSMVDGIFQGRDDDPGDDPATQGVNIQIQEELVLRELNNNPDTSIDDDFRGTIDTYISRLDPSSSFGSSPELRVSATIAPDEQNPGDEFILIGFPAASILGLFTTLDTDNIEDLSATLELRLASGVLPSSDAVSAHQLLQNFSENARYADFGNDGVPGPTADNEYTNEELEVSVNFLDGTLQIDVTDTIQAMLDGELATNPSWIIVPTAITSGVFGSSEGDSDFRPLLTVTFQETLEDVPNTGCYPDLFVNNRSDIPDDPGTAPTNPMWDSSFEATGVVVFLSSQNRDTRGFVNPDRLESTVVALELVGQEFPQVGLSPAYGFLNGDQTIGGDIDHFAGAEGSPAGSGLLMGCRFQPGWYDFVNDGNTGQAAPRTDYFGEHVASMPDMDNDNFPEIIISTPRNELYLDTIRTEATTAAVRHTASTHYRGSILVLPSANYGVSGVATDPDGNQTIPSHSGNDGTCTIPRLGRNGTNSIRGGFEVFAEDIRDFLGGAEYAGDVNLDGSPDLLCGAPLNDHPSGLTDTGAAYIIYGRTPVGDVFLSKLNDPRQRPPTLRIRGETAGDKIGTVQTHGRDINGDRIDDVFIASPTADFGGVTRTICGDIDGNGIIDGNDLDVGTFTACQSQFGEEVFLDDACKPYDFDNDRDIDSDDRDVFDCLLAGFANCCPVDNGFVGVIFGNVQLDGDRGMSRIGTVDLPGIKFFGASAGDRAGADVASAGDFNRDGFGDLLIAAPGVIFTDDNGRERMGVAYLIFGGTHLSGNKVFSLDQVGTTSLPGMVIWSPFFAGRPNEAPIDNVGALGDINGDGFDDIGIGITRADFLDSAFPQDPNDPGTDPNIGRRPDDGNVYIIYGNNTGSNR